MLRSFALAAAAMFAAVPTALAVVNTDNRANMSAPANDPGWDYLGKMGLASAVYVGNGWVLTANHVANGTLVLPSGSFGRYSGEGIRLENPASLGLENPPDLKMLRLINAPSLDDLTIAASPPPVGAEVIMIGNGQQRPSKLTGWNVDDVGDDLVWTEVAPPFNQQHTTGYELMNPRVVAWAANRIEDDEQYFEENDANHTRVLESVSGDTVSLIVEFDPSSDSNHVAFEGQAVTGDSGGAMFYEAAGDWELTGIMLSAGKFRDQPAATAIFGNLTYSADLSIYSDQIEFIRDTALSDLTRDGSVDFDDLTLLLANWNTGTTLSHGDIVDPTNSSVDFDDLTFMLSQWTGPLPPPSPSSLVPAVPEPSTFTLALLAMSLMATRARRWRKR